MKKRYEIEIKSFDKPHLELTIELIDKLTKPINENKVIIFETVGSIEWRIEKILSFYFYGKFTETNKEFINKFKSHVLSSDWCTFSTKKKLVVHIINELKLLEGAEKDKYGKLLQDTMSYRNALTHGVLSTDGRIIKLSYYEGKPKEITLDSPYFKKIDTTLNECYILTNKIIDKLELRTLNSSITNK